MTEDNSDKATDGPDKDDNNIELPLSSGWEPGKGVESPNPSAEKEHSFPPTPAQPSEAPMPREPGPSGSMPGSGERPEAESVSEPEEQQVEALPGKAQLFPAPAAKEGVPQFIPPEDLRETGAGNGAAAQAVASKEKSDPGKRKVVIKKRKKTCPKCGNIQDGFSSCYRCGLIFSNWRPELKTAQYADVPTQVLKEAQNLWDAVSESQVQETVLKAFHDYCINNGAGNFAAVCYREHLSKYPDDETVQGLKEKILLQSSMLLPQATTRKERSGLGAGGAVATFVIVLAFAIFVFWFISNQFSR